MGKVFGRPQKGSEGKQLGHCRQQALATPWGFQRRTITPALFYEKPLPASWTNVLKRNRVCLCDNKFHESNDNPSSKPAS